MIWNPWRRAALAEKDFEDCFAVLVQAYADVNRLYHALEHIRNLETVHANATVKKMAKIAQEALENEV